MAAAQSTSTSTARFETIDPRTDLRWRASLTGRGNDLFTDQRWLSVLHRTYGFEFCANTIADDTTIHAALPHVIVDDIRGARIVSLPFCDFVDAPADETSWPRIADPLIEMNLPLRVETPSGHPAAIDARFDTVVDGVHHVIGLADDPSDLLAGYATLTRRQIRRSAREGIGFEASTDLDDLAAFHRLHVDVRKRRHLLLAQPFEMFEHIADEFFGDGASCLIIARHDDMVVGGCLMLATAGTLHYKFSASHPDARAAGVSHGAVHAAALHAHAHGLDRLDLGRSDLAHEGLVQFKRRFRPVERTLETHTIGRTDQPAADKLLHDMTALMVDPDVPDHITAAAGARLYRYFA